MGRKKRTFTGEFKLKVATEALAGGKTIQAIATEHGVTTSLVCTWKKVLQKEGPMFFDEKSARQKESEKKLKELEAQNAELLSQYGKSQLENILLKKKLKILD